jgi:chromosome segregation ATPase
MARGGVTFTEVEEAAQYLQGLGRNPTVDAIREHLGTGSRTTLAEHLKCWKSLQADGEGRLPKPLLAVVTGLWDNLQSLAMQCVQENIAHQEMAALHSQLQVAKQIETKLTQTLHQLQETCDAEQRIKSALAIQLQMAEKSYDKLSATHQSVLEQLDNVKQENQRLHQLAMQIQANLEHYQHAIQQQQQEQNLAKEKQYAMYTQELTQLRTLLDDSNVRFYQSEKKFSANQFQMEETQKNHTELIKRYETVATKNQEMERAITQLTAHADYQKKQTEKNESALSAEQHSHNKLQQQMAVFAEQLQCARSNLRQAEDKIEALRQEKLFLSQEKAQMGGVLKHLQTTKGVA